ncbi:hypothetical protein [Mycobacterium rhizamassiliense]|uniref:hypothetical protein n=1 Tax=Mycobacterium rhizamassiliense TaxID=1841860 RepID=UPI0012FF90E9|nr:hypothetical protein [Mycobacterium rhizamassiliense]
MLETHAREHHFLVQGFREAENSLVGRAVRRATITGGDEHDLGYAEICSGLSKRYGTRFKLEITGNCAILSAELEGGIRVVITDCEGPLSPVGWHLDGRAAGFFVGLHPAEPETGGGAEVDVLLAYAYSEMAPPTAEAISDLVQEALGRASSQPERLLRGQREL